jgi:WhiB family redox-sensing transcriptional regulator
MSIIGELFGISRPEKWMEESLCSQIGDDTLWFPAPGFGAGTARKVCEACPVLETCREYAITSPEPLHGIWGGLGARERQTIRARRNEEAA